MIARENPFATHRTERLKFRMPPSVNWPGLLEKLKGMNYCGAVVGRNGAGKSVLMEQFQPHLKELGFEPKLIRLTSESSMREKEALPKIIRQVVKPGFILLDGAEQLSTRHWLPVRSAAGVAAGFVVTVHRVSRLPTLIECDTSSTLLEDLVRELSGQTLPTAEALDLYGRHFGNMRDCLRELYDEWAAKGQKQQAA